MAALFCDTLSALYVDLIVPSQNRCVVEADDEALSTSTLREVSVANRWAGAMRETFLM